MKRLITILSVAATLCTSGLAQDVGINLRIDVEGARPDKGQILASLFDSEATYLKAPRAEQATPVEGDGTASIEFSELPAGDYAVSIVYDRDSDGKLDTGLFGIPTEKVGFSNNARGRMGPAPWSKSVFELTSNNSTVRISLQKAKRD